MKKSKNKRERLKRRLQPAVVYDAKDGEKADCEAYINGYGEVFFVCDGSIVPKNYNVSNLHLV